MLENKLLSGFDIVTNHPGPGYNGVPKPDGLSWSGVPVLDKYGPIQYE